MKLRVYAVWTPALPTDERSAWDAGLLDDGRVTSLWDRDLAVSTWAAETAGLGVEPLGPVVYDAFVLFAPDARWDSVPTGRLAAGLPILGESSKLATAIEQLVSGS